MGMIFLAILLFALAGVAFYVSYKSYKKAYIQEDEPVFKYLKYKKFLKKPPKDSFDPLNELTQNTKLTFRTHKIFDAEQEKIFDFLSAHLPLTHVHVFTHCTLHSFLEHENATACFDDFYHQQDVHFLIVGKKTKTPLMAIDYSQEAVSQMSKKHMFKQAKIPYVAIKREAFMKEGVWQEALLQDWIREHIIMKFKV